jgi:hypothetical protein
MRISSIFITSLFVLNISAVGRESCSQTKSFVKDDQGRILIYRAQPSLWGLPSSVLLTGLGLAMTHGAWYQQNPKIRLDGSFTLRDIWPDLHDVLANILVTIPFPSLRDKPARAVKCAIGAGVTVTGASLLSSWVKNYWKLSTPLIIIDYEGLQYEGKNFIRWQDVKSMRIEYDMTVHWFKGKIKKEPCLEIIDTYGRLMIHESDIAITVEALYEFMKQYHKRWC